MAFSVGNEVEEGGSVGGEGVGEEVAPQKVGSRECRGDKNQTSDWSPSRGARQPHPLGRNHATGHHSASGTEVGEGKWGRDREEGGGEWGRARYAIP